MQYTLPMEEMCSVICNIAFLRIKIPKTAQGNIFKTCNLKIQLQSLLVLQTTIAWNIPFKQYYTATCVCCTYYIIIRITLQGLRGLQGLQGLQRLHCRDCTHLQVEKRTALPLPTTEQGSSCMSSFTNIKHTVLYFVSTYPLNAECTSVSTWTSITAILPFTSELSKRRQQLWQQYRDGNGM